MIAVLFVVVGRIMLELLLMLVAELPTATGVEEKEEEEEDNVNVVVALLEENEDDDEEDEVDASETRRFL